MRLLLVSLIAAFLSAADLNPDAARKLDEVRKVFETAWKRYFSPFPNPPDPPGITAFTKSSTSSCGPLPSGNAYYCEKDNTIYYDSEFLEVLRKRIGTALNTSGDAAPLVAIAHEMGHAIYAQVRETPAGAGPPYQKLNGYGEEKVADCFAGVMIRAAFDSKLLNASNLLEAEQTMFAIGDSLKSGDGVVARHKNRYPNWRVRRDMFLKGFRQGTCSGNMIENLSTQ